MKKILLFFLAITRCAIGDVTWSSPAQISTALTNASDPHIVIDTNDNATAVWVENTQIQASTLPSGGSWSAITTLSNPANSASTPKLAIDSSGNVTALWIESGSLNTATLVLGGSWQTQAIPLSSNATNPTLAIDSNSNAVAVWVNGSSIMASSRLLVSGSWSITPTMLASSNASNPHVAISSVGTAMAVWHSVVSGADVIVTDQLTVSAGIWSGTKNVFSGTAAFYHNYPKVTLDSKGNATVAWFRYNSINNTAYQNVMVLSSTLTSGSSAWSIPSALSSGGLRNPSDLTIKIKYDPSGNVLVVWTNSYDGELFYIESAKMLYGSPWPNSILIDAPTIFSRSFDLAITSSMALLTCQFWDYTDSIAIRSHQIDPEQPNIQICTPPITMTTNNNSSPSCAISQSGTTYNAAAAWVHYDGSNTIIQASAGSDTTISQPINVSASQSSINYGVYTDYCNTITWNASADPTVIQYNLYRNGVFFTSTAANVFQFVDHNATQGASVVYGVAALTSSYRQSPIATFTLIP